MYPNLRTRWQILQQLLHNHRKTSVAFLSRSFPPDTMSPFRYAGESFNKQRGTKKYLSDLSLRLNWGGLRVCHLWCNRELAPQVSGSYEVLFRPILLFTISLNSSMPRSFFFLILLSFTSLNISLIVSSLIP